MNAIPAAHDQARLTESRIFSRLLAEEYVLYTTTHDYHLNVTGPYFHGLHLLFKAQYHQIHEWLDEVAARTRAMGVGARRDWSDLPKRVRFFPDPGAGLPADDMLAELLALHEALVIQLRADAACTENLGDNGSAAFLHSLLQQHEKAACLLRHLVESAEDESPASLFPLPS